MFDETRDDYGAQDDSYRQAELFNSEKNYARALEQAIELHCQDKMVPEKVARFCRTCAVNLNRNLQRQLGLEPGPIKGRLEDFYRLNLCGAKHKGSSAVCDKAKGHRGPHCDSTFDPWEAY